MNVKADVGVDDGISSSADFDVWPKMKLGPSVFFCTIGFEDWPKVKGDGFTCALVSLLEGQKGLKSKLVHSVFFTFWG